MAETGPTGGSIHPIGWSFVGGGVALLWPGLSLHLGLPLTAPLDWTSTQLLWLVFAVSLFGAFFDFLLHQTLEKALVRITSLKNPSSKAWSAMWKMRWRSAQPDQEMRRHEGMVSLSRAYLFYSLTGGLLLATASLPASHRVLWGVGGVGLALFCGYMWFWHTRLIFVIVRSAKKWEDDI